MKNDYYERKQRRLETAERLAAQNESKSSAAFEASHKLGDAIPFGQPILVGHHSEKAHRRHISQIHKSMDNAVELSKKAAYYADKAKTIASNKAISSDNPDAIDELKIKLNKLIKKQEMLKAINKITLSKKLSNDEKIKKLVELNVTEATATEFITGGNNYGRPGVPSYMLTNNNANIRTIKKRIEQLEKISTIEYSEEDFSNGIQLVINPDKNRVQIIFPGKPNDEARKDLKGFGFNWSPNEGAWQRMISDSAIYRAKKLIEGLVAVSNI